MGNLFVIEGLVKPYILATDSSLIKSNGKIWHKSSMKEGIVPCSGIDTNARWGRSRTNKGWVLGYKLHMICSTEPSSRIIPLSADVTTANVSDKPIYPDVVSSLSPETLKEIYYLIADPGFSSKKLYDLSLKRGFELVCPVKRYKRTSEERLKLVDFYELALGQVVYSRRSSIEPLIEHIKSIFRIDPVPVKGLDKVPCIVLLSVLFYQILVYYNCKILKNDDNPRKDIKYMIGC